MNALREDGRARDFTFLSFDFTATARAAAPCATFAALASGSQYVTPYSASCPISMAVYIWWIPVTTVGAYRPPMTRLPSPRGSVKSHWMPYRTAFSAQTNTGPITARVRYPVTNTLTRGVTNRSSTSGTILCSRFSINASSHTAITTGITWP